MNKRKLANLIVAKIPQVNIAAAMGVTEARIAQLLKEDTELAQLITEVTAARTESDLSKELSLDRIETQLISRISGLVNDTESLGEATRSLALIKEIQAKERLIKTGTTQQNKPIQLTINTVIANNLTLKIHKNSQGQIEAIGERSMAPMTTNQVLKVLSHDDKPLQELLLGETS